ncbi:MAG: hypothetical protein PHT69_07645 [Bacteroidales bacterium]|nr:hypothetical protein [Bacteroidales bacterium]
MTRKKKIYFIAIVIFAIIATALFLVIKKKFISLPKPGNNVVEFNSEHHSCDFYKPNIITVDFENFDADAQIISDFVHAGEKACLVSGKNTFSPVIKKTVKDIGLRYMTRVGISAYVYVLPQQFEDLDAQLVVSVTDDAGKNIFWQGVGINSRFFSSAKWLKVSGAFDMNPQDINENQFVNVYLWNNSNTQIIIDDIFVVFGTDQNMPGDTTNIRTGENGFALPLFNFPPHETIFAEKDSLNKDALLLLLDVLKELKNDKINEAVCIGNFIMTGNRLDKILFTHAGQLKVLAYCEREDKFLPFSVLSEAELINSWPNSIKLKGKFNSTTKEDVVLVDTLNEKLFLLNFSDNAQCSDYHIPIQLSTKTYSFDAFTLNRMKPFYWHIINPERSGHSKLLCIYGTGLWQVFSISDSGLRLLNASKAGKSLPDFPSNRKYFKLISGNFMAQNSKELLLQMTFNQGFHYNLLFFNETKNAFETVMRKTLTIGLDTLKPIYSYFTVNNKLGHQDIIKYDNSWRFDLKLLQFNDTTFQVMKAIDFKNQDAFVNPKFYELSALLAGHFVNHGYTSLICVCANCKDSNYDGRQCNEFYEENSFPNTVHIFRLR